MQSSNAYYLKVLIICLSALAGCNKGEQENIQTDTVFAIGSSKNHTGIGDNDGMPDGLQLQLPACVKIVDRPGYRFNVQETKIFGSTRTFYVPVSFVNTCTGSAPVELPAGLILNSQYRDGQNGLLVERVLVDVPPSNQGNANDTTTIYLAVSCLNENRTPPVSMHDAQYNIADFGYSVGKISIDTNLLRFIKLLEGIDGIRVSSFITNLPPEPGTESALDKMYTEIQIALWKITDGDGLTADDVQKLRKSLSAFQ